MYPRNSLSNLCDSETAKIYRNIYFCALGRWVNFCVSTRADEVRRANEEKQTALMALGLISGDFHNKDKKLNLNLKNN